MKNKKLEGRLGEEIVEFIDSRKTLQLASITPEGNPYASYTPFCCSANGFYILVSEIACHAINLQKNTTASVLFIQDESLSPDIYARVRVLYQVAAQIIPYGDDAFQSGVDQLAARQGEIVQHLAKMDDFKLFHLLPKQGRYVKGYGRAYELQGYSRYMGIEHMKDGHTERKKAS